MTWRWLVVWASLEVLAPVGMAGQVTTLAGAPECGACVVQLRHTLTLGGAVGLPGEAEYYAAVSLWPPDRIVVLPVATAAVAPLVFGSDGSFLGPLGRPGQGPGEFIRPWRVVVGPGDSLYVVDRGQSRMSVVAPDGSPTRTFPLPPAVDEVAFVDGQLVVAAPVMSRASAGYPLHLLNLEGRPIHSFGAEHPMVDPRSPFRNRRLLVPTVDAVWSVNLGMRYRFEKWSLDGRLLAAFERTADWYPPYDRIEMPSRTRPPDAHAMAAWLDSRGRLWIVLTVAGLRWRDALRGTVRGEDGREYPKVADREAYRDAIIEVFDVARGRLLVSSRVEPELRYLVGPGLMGAHRESPEGAALVDVYRLTLAP